MRPAIVLSVSEIILSVLLVSRGGESLEYPNEENNRQYTFLMKESFVKL
jgi:hypothetical protein